MVIDDKFRIWISKAKIQRYIWRMPIWLSRL